MVPAALSVPRSRSLGIVYPLLNLASKYVGSIVRGDEVRDASVHGAALWKRASDSHKFDPHDPKKIVFVCLIPVLVLSSGLFAGTCWGN